MDVRLRNACIAFAAGAVGALVNSLTVWLFGKLGITAALGVAIAPGLTPAWLYPRLVWGGLWGFMLFLPIRNDKIWVHGLIIGLAPSLAQWLIFFPRAGHELLGFDLGTLAPVLVVLFNAIWGWATVAVARRAGFG